jgi:hypothetical protein
MYKRKHRSRRERGEPKGNARPRLPPKPGRTEPNQPLTTPRGHHGYRDKTVNYPFQITFDMDNLKRLLQRNDMRKLIPNMTKRMVLLPVLWLIATSSVFGFEIKLGKSMVEEKPVPHDVENRPTNIPPTAEEQAIAEAESYKERVSQISDSEELHRVEMEINKLPRGTQNEIRGFMRPKIRDFLNQRMRLLEDRIRKQRCDFSEFYPTLLSDLLKNGKALLPNAIGDGFEIASNSERADPICVTFAFNLLKETLPSFVHFVVSGVASCLALPQAIASISEEVINRILDLK